MLNSTIQYLDKAYDDAARASIYDGISPRLRALLAKIDNVGWYPKTEASELFAAIANHHLRTGGNVRETLENVGVSISETAMNTFLKLILKLLTPALFKAKASDFWRRDHNFGILEISKLDTDEREMEVALKEVDGYDYIGPVGLGFIRFALEDVFKFKNVRATYDWSIDNPGPPVVEYKLTWD